MNESTLKSDKNDLDDNLRTVLKDILKKAHPSDTLKVNGTRLNINTVLFNDFEYYEPKANSHFIKLKFTGIYFAKHSDGFHDDYLVLSFGESKFADTLDNGKLQFIENICTIDSALRHDWSVSVSDIFSIRNIPLNENGKMASFFWPVACTECLDCGKVILPDSLNKKAINYFNALKGFPAYSSGSFWRMFYLSAVTITTVGYGDIVPITTKARIIVSIEAIWGIVLIGIFLNSLANKIIRKNN